MIYSVNKGGFRMAYSTIPSALVFLSARLLKKGQAGTIPYINIFVSVLERSVNHVVEPDFLSEPFFYGWGSCKDKKFDPEEFFISTSFISYYLYINYDA
ncbi:MAG: hypothetical protein LUE98_13025 [Tannerellaceae bacterium]|nr:hypothetical protein [Tannerellaceae bacterium]